MICFFIKMAFKYLSWVLYPLFGCYAVYSLIYVEHKGWYSWVLSMLYGFLLTFGKCRFTTYSKHTAKCPDCEPHERCTDLTETRHKYTPIHLILRVGLTNSKKNLYIKAKYYCRIN